MTTHSTVYIGENTHIVEVTSLRDNLGVADTAATVTLETIEDTDGTEVEGITFPISLSHVEEGTYRATIPHGGEFVSGHRYYATIKAEGSQNFHAQWRETLIAKVRTA